MAVLDLRLLELVETLAAARLDWLAFELIEGVQAGHLAEEPEDALASARRSIRGDTQPKARGEPRVSAAEAKAIPLEEQIEWAASYIERRLDEALEQLQSSIETLDFVVEGTTERLDRAGTAAQTADAPRRQMVSVLLDESGDRKSDRDGVGEGRESLPALRAALSEWVAQSRGQATLS